MVQMEEKHGSLEINFKTPPNEFRMMPFWFWNHEMVEKEVTRQIQDHHDHGIGGEFIHPRHGRLTPYMGRRWLENVEAAADKCKELDMPCFLYDEDNWPSGPVSGKITGPYHPENRGKYIIMFDEDDFEGPTSIEYELDYQNFGPETAFLAAIAVPSTDKYPDFSEVISQKIDLSSYVENGVLKWDVPEGDWTVAFFAIAINDYNANMGGYIDILRKETVKQFIDETHQKYVDWFISQGKEDYLGTVVPGIFTDEPSMAHKHIAGGGMLKSFIFTPEMPHRFKEMHGYDFNDILISMCYETGAISAKHRCNYWDCVIDLYVNAFYGQIEQFCDKYNWRHTGHINSEGSFPSHITNHGDFFKVFEHMHYGGCDQLQEIVRPDGIEDVWDLKTTPYVGMAKDVVLASKLASSAAHLLGKPRVLVEAFGSSAWDITLASAKRVNDFLIATGCDLFVPHDFAYSEDGYRKLDHPASFNHQPYYLHWKKLADHNARLCATLNAHSGVLNAEVLYLYPSTSFHAEMMPNTSDITEVLSDLFTHNADCMYRQQIDFELANEDMIVGGKIETSQEPVIKIRDQEFKVLFLGGSTCISLSFAKMIRDFYKAGGKILATTLIPYKDKNKGESDEIKEIIKEIFNCCPFDTASALKGKKISEMELKENSNAAGGQAIFIQTPSMAVFKGPYFPLVQQAFEKLIPSDKKSVNVYRDPSNNKHASYVMAIHKTIENREFYFMANTSSVIDYFNTRVELACIPKSVELWNSESGEITEFTSYSIDSGKLVMNLDFPLYKSYLFVVTPSENPADVQDLPMADDLKKKSNLPLKTINLGNDWGLKLNDPNCAMLYQKWLSSYEVESSKGWRYVGTRKFSHEFYIKNKDAIGTVRLVIEGLTGDYGWGKTTYDELEGGDRAHFKIPSGVGLYVNDKRVSMKFDFDFEYVDACWIITDITSKLQEGKNTVRFESITRNHGTFHVVTDPWRLIGNFESEKKDGIPHLSPPRDKVVLGDLTEQGFARYHGGFSYMTNIDIPADDKGKKYVLNVKNTTDCVEVHVNGQLCEVLWKEWKTDISNLLKYGESNQIELIHFGIAQNLLQTNIQPFGLGGEILLHVYEK